MKSYAKLSLLSILLITLGCKSTKLFNLHKFNYATADTVEESIVAVHINRLPIVVEKEQPVFFTSLPDSLKSIYLKIIANKTKRVDSLLLALQTPIFKPAASNVKTKISDDYTSFQIRLSIAVEKQYYKDKNFWHPNTRLDQLMTKLRINNGDFQIIGIDKVQNEFEEYNLGTIQRVATNSFDGSLEGKTGLSSNREIVDVDSTNSRTVTKKSGVGGDLAASVSASAVEAITENIDLAQRRMHTGFYFHTTSLTIFQKARPLVEISNNVFVTLDLRDKSGNAKNETIFESDSLSKLSLNNLRGLQVHTVRLVPCKGNKPPKLSMDVEYEGLVRRVKNRLLFSGNSMLEYDDRVEYVKIKSATSDQSKKEQIIISSRDFCKDVYRVKAAGSGTEGFKEVYVQIKEYPKIPLLVLGDTNTSDNIFSWLNDAKKQPKKDRLSTNLTIWIPNGDNMIELMGSNPAEANELASVKFSLYAK